MSVKNMFCIEDWCLLHAVVCLSTSLNIHTTSLANRLFNKSSAVSKQSIYFVYFLSVTVLLYETLHGQIVEILAINSA